MKVWVVIPHDGFAHADHENMRVFMQEPVGLVLDERFWVFEVEAEHAR